MKKNKSHQKLHLLILASVLQLIFLTQSFSQQDTLNIPKPYLNAFCRSEIKSTQLNDGWVLLEDTYFQESFAPIPSTRTYRKWYFSDGTTASGTQVKKQFTSPGIYQVTLYKAFYDTLIDPEKVCLARYYDIAQGQYDPCHYQLVCESKESISLEVQGGYENYSCKATINNIQNAQQFSFSDPNATQDPKNYRTYYFWDFGDKHFAEGKTTQHLYDLPGNYVVTLSKVLYKIPEAEVQCQSLIFDSLYNVAIPCYFEKVCSDVAQIKISASPSVEPHCLSKINFNLDQQTGIFKDDYYLQTLAPESVVTFWRWDFGDGSYGLSREAKHVYKPGAFKVTLTKVSYFIDSSAGIVCYGMKYDSLFDTNIYCNYKELCRTSTDLWVKVPVIDPLSEGGCTASVIQSTNNLSVHLTDTITWLSAPTQMRDISPITWLWEFSDGAQALGSSVEHTFSSPGTYTVVLTKTVNSPIECITTPCPNQFCQQTYKYVIQDGKFAEDCRMNVRYTVGKNRLVSFEKEVTAPGTVDQGYLARYYYNYGDGAYGTSLDHQYTSNGTYHGFIRKALYKAVPTFAPCPEDSFDITLADAHPCGLELICVQDNPFSLQLYLDEPRCFTYDVYPTGQGDSIVFHTAPSTAGVFNITHSWDFGDGGFANGDEVSHVFTGNGIKNICMVASAPNLSVIPCCLQISPVSKDAVAGVYPQPLDQEGNFTLSNFQGTYNVLISDVNGKTIRSIEGVTEPSFQFQKGDLKPGLYFFQVESQGRLISHGRMVVQ